MPKYTTIKTDDGTVKFCCPNCNTWAKVSPEQYRGEAEMVCPHPECGWKGTVNLALEEAEAAPKPDKPAAADHF